MLYRYLFVLSLIAFNVFSWSQEQKEFGDQRDGVSINIIDIVKKEISDSCTIQFSSKYGDTTFRNINGSNSFVLNKNGKYVITINNSGYSQKSYEFIYEKNDSSISPPIVFHIYPKNYSEGKRIRAYRKYKKHLRRKDRKSPKKTCAGMNGFPVVIM